MSAPAVVTVKWLKESNACADQVRRFRKAFGASVRPTPTRIRKAARIGLDLSWYARRTLTGKSLRVYQAANMKLWRGCQAAYMKLWRVYQTPGAEPRRYETAYIKAYTAYAARCAETLIAALWPGVA